MIMRKLIKKNCFGLNSFIIANYNISYFISMSFTFIV